MFGSLARCGRPFLGSLARSARLDPSAFSLNARGIFDAQIKYEGARFPTAAIVRRQFVLQGGFDPSKKSGVGVDFEHLVNSLPGPNKDRARKPSLI